MDSLFHFFPYGKKDEETQKVSFIYFQVLPGDTSQIVSFFSFDFLFSSFFHAFITLLKSLEILAGRTSKFFLSISTISQSVIYIDSKYGIIDVYMFV